MTPRDIKKTNRSIPINNTTGDEVAYTYMFAIKLACVINHELSIKRPVILSLKRLAKYFPHHRLITGYLHKMFKTKRDGSWLIISSIKSRSLKFQDIDVSESEMRVISEIIS